MKRYRVRALALGFAAVLAWSCVDATDINRLEISASGVLFGVAFLDMDGDSSPSAFDEPIEGVLVAIRAVGSTEIVSEVTTDTLGVFLLEDVPVGTYTLMVDTAFLSDSLATVLGDVPITVALGDTIRVDLGVSFPEMTLEEARAEPPGRRVFTSGIALNVRQPFGDGVVFFQGDSLYLRATNVERANLNVGDSVRLLGRTAINNGQPTLDGVTPSVVVPLAAIPIVEEIATGVADSARGGVLDAALARVRNAEISDTSTVNGDFLFWVDDGSGRVEVVLRSFLGFDPTSIRPDTIVRIQRLTGLLAPLDDGTGNVRWRLLPRAPSEVVLQTKFADVGVVTNFDAAQASPGDTLEITVVATNAGPLVATGVEVTDTIPPALTYLSSTATSGAYDPITGTWSINTLTVGATDTLLIEVEVSSPTFGAVLNLVRIGGLDAEVDQNGGNNVASATVNIGPKVADVGVATSFDTATASQGDTVEILIVADNAGPRVATGVEVTDTIPLELSFISSSATSGSYDQSTGIWTIDTLAVTGSDTLRIDVEVTSATAGTVVNRAWIGGLDGEVDQNANNNRADATLDLVTPAPVSPSPLNGSGRISASWSHPFETRAFGVTPPSRPVEEPPR